MTPRPPKVIFVIALLHLFLGCVGLLANTYRSTTYLAGDHLGKQAFTAEQRQEQQILEEKLQAKVPLLAFYQSATLAYSWLLTVLLLTAGVGLVRVRPAGWTLSIGYAILSILHKLGTAAYTVIFLLPLYQAPLLALEVRQTVPLGRPAFIGPDPRSILVVAETTSILTAVAVPLLLMVYPFLVLLVMLRGNVRRAFWPPVQPS